MPLCLESSLIAISPGRTRGSQTMLDAKEHDFSSHVSMAQDAHASMQEGHGRSY